MGFAPRSCPRPVWVLLIIAMILSPASRGRAADAPPTPPPPLTFDKTGAQFGEQLPDMTITDLKGETENLYDTLHGRPVLLLTSSLSCPKSRSSYPKAEKLAEALKDKIDVEIIYVLEAHPKGDPSPYRGYEDVTAENLREGILLRQPTTLDERLKLANDFKKRLGVKPDVYVDGMNNALWRQLGGGPNMGVLIDPSGIVIARQGWFDADSMQKAAEKFLAAAKQTQRPDRDAQTPEDKALAARMVQEGFDDWKLPETFEKGDVKVVQDLLAKYPGLARFTEQYQPRGDRGGCTMLHYAAKAGQARIAELLLAAGADVAALNHHGDSPLHLAAEQGQRDMADLLIRHGADVNLKSLPGPTPLQEAAIHGHQDVVELLVKSGATPNLFSWCATGDAENVRKVLDEDPTRAFRPDGRGRRLLEYAAAAGEIEVAKLLMSYGVKDENPPQSRWGDTALHWATRQKHVEMAKFLMDSGSDVNATGAYLETPLHDAVDAASVPMIQAIMQHKPNAQAFDMGGFAALHVAALRGSVEMVTALIDGGADINALTGANSYPCGPPGPPDVPKQTPLELAAEMGRTEVVRLLVARGANVHLATSAGETPLHAAAGSELKPAEKTALVQMLIDAGADVNAKTQKGQTPLDLLQDADTAVGGAAELLKQHGAKAGDKPKSE